MKMKKSTGEKILNFGSLAGILLLIGLKLLSVNDYSYILILLCYFLFYGIMGVSLVLLCGMKKLGFTFILSVLFLVIAVIFLALMYI